MWYNILTKRGGQMKLEKISLKKYVLLIFLFVIVTAGTLIALDKALHMDLDFSLVPHRLWLILLAMMFIYIVLDATRFYVILDALDIHFTAREMLSLTVIGTCVSNLTPFLAGGSIAQIYLIHQKNVNTGDAIAGTIIKAMLAQVFFFLSLPIILYFNIDTLGFEFEAYRSVLPVIFIGFLLWIIFVVVFSFFYQKPIDKLKNKLAQRPDSKKKEMLIKVVNEIDVSLSALNRFFRVKPIKILKAMFFTALHFMFVFSFSVVIILSLGYNLSPGDIITHQMLSQFIMYFGFTPGASGFAEGGFAYLFSNLVSDTHLGVVVFLWRFFTVYLVMGIGFVALVFEVIKVRRKVGQHERISR